MKTLPLLTSENEQAYMIDKVEKYLKNNKPTYERMEIKYWIINTEKMIRKFEVAGKTFIQISNPEEESKTFLSYSSTEFDLRYFRTELTIDQLDRLLN